MILINLRRKFKIFLLFSISLFLILIFNLQPIHDKFSYSSKIKEIPKTAWESLSQKRILFGHQSVGFNIVDGMKDVLNDNSQIKMNIIESNTPWEVQKTGLIHFAIGQNTIPESKINTFLDILQQHNWETVDIAFFKFCFIDITSNTDVYKLFNEYRDAIESLKKSFPKTTFIYFTDPLTSEPTGVKRLLRRVKYLVQEFIQGKTNKFSDNITRNEFNDLLRNEYEGKAPIFDLAKIESTFTNGNRSMFSENGKNYFSLVPDYTDDGAHLNKLGRKIAAQQLLIFLAKLSQ